MKKKTKKKLSEKPLHADQVSELLEISKGQLYRLAQLGILRRQGPMFMLTEVARYITGSGYRRRPRKGTKIPKAGFIRRITDDIVRGKTQEQITGTDPVVRRAEVEDTYVPPPPPPSRMATLEQRVVIAENRFVLLDEELTGRIDRLEKRLDTLLERLGEVIE